MTNYNGLITILMVDDRPANLVALEAVLGKVEYHLIEAHSGKEALAILHSRHDIDIILLDVQMPEMDGFECAAHIKQIPHCKDIPIIFITAIYKEDPFIRKGYEVGAIDYFSKPFDPEILRTKVKIYSSFRHKNRLLRERETRIQESEELLKTGRKLSAILETLPVGVIIADQQGHICQSNEQVSRILKSAELIQKDSYAEILGWWDGKGRLMKNPNGPLIRAITKGESSHNETMEVECFDGTKKTLVASASPLRGLDGHIMGAVVVVQDITEHKKIEADMESRILRLISVGVELESIHR